MYKPSPCFVAISTILLTAALLAGKSHLLVPVVASGILLDYGCSVFRRSRNARRTLPENREEELVRVEKQRYLLAKEALLDGARRKQLRKPQ